VAERQAALDAWVVEYNTARPHQSCGGRPPGKRFAFADRSVAADGTAAVKDDRIESQVICVWGAVMNGQAITQRDITKSDITECDPAGLAPAICAPGFVGREQDLATLARALAGGPAVVVVEGEAGIGKTRLVTELLASPAMKARKALVACCPPLRTPWTLGPVVEAVRQAVASVHGLPLSGLAGALRPLFPEWGDVLPPSPGSAADATAARHRLFAAVAELLGCIHTAVLVVEDAHWADEATLEFLLYMASRRPRPVSLVITCRPEDTPERSLLRRLWRLAAGSSGVRITLGPLDVAQTGRLVSSMLAGGPVSADFAAFLHERTEGVPLAVEESVRLLAERARLSRRRGEWMRRPVEEITVPPTIRDGVLERAGRLSAAARVVLQAVAVLAEPAAESVVAAVAGLAADRVQAGLAEALGSGLVAEDGRGHMSFRHMLACRAVYETIAAPQRRMLHGRAGQALQAVSPAPLARLAWHFGEAGDTGQWRRYGEQAADLALAAGDDATASTVLHGLVTGAGLGAREIARLTQKIMLQALPGDSQLADLARALRTTLDARSHAPADAANLRFQLGRVLIAMDEDDACRAELERAVPHLPRGSLQATRAMTLLGWPLGMTSTASEHLLWLRRAAGAARSLEPSERLRLTVDRATALLMLGEQEGWTEAAQLPGEAPGPRERLHITRGHANIGEAAMLWGRYDEARRMLVHAVELADRYGYPRLGRGAAVTLAHLDWLSGTWAGLAARAASMADEDDLGTLARLEAVLVTALLPAPAARAKAADRLEHVFAEAHRRGAGQYLMEPAAALARLWLADGRVEDTLRLTGEAMDIVASKGVWLWATDLAPARVTALTAAGHTHDAAGLISEFARWLRGHHASAPKAGLATCRAILAEAGGEHAQAAGLFARAAAAWRALPRPYDALLASEHQACCLVAAGSAETGLALLAEVMPGLSALGAPGDADRVARTLRRHGGAVPRVWRGGRRGYGDQLSPRELEVVQLVIAGNTNKEIARALCRSPDTVATQLKSAMRKLGVSTRTALAVRATAAGVTPHGGRGHLTQPE
jgi:DNA-binding CsgD family transcriptional regulator